MRLGVSLRLANDNWDDAAAYAVEAERLGVDYVWSAEAWGHDAATPLAFVAARTSRVRLGTAIMQAGTRTPALVAMTAMSLDAMSGGRFILGLGVSGPQVIEGWHGIPFERRSAASASVTKAASTSCRCPAARARRCARRRRRGPTSRSIWRRSHRRASR
jgi:alkanesulfonate monooxygenase SsuD/methylene tetrahydromethanopterin reductase-like flavin-dependent oxidoreductase (luciferase family)